jgi:formimidoylglutamate deiminase
MKTIEADLTWTGSRFESGVQIAVDEVGRITEVGALGKTADQRLTGRALLPGLVTAHSHAFQRGLRGLGETFPAGNGSFWTWREAMYDLVGRLDTEELHTLSLRAFREMRRAGITTVGEFHYVHHRDPDALDYAFDEVVLAAARRSPPPSTACAPAARTTSRRSTTRPAGATSPSTSTSRSSGGRSRR